MLLNIQKLPLPSPAEFEDLPKSHFLLSLKISKILTLFKEMNVTFHVVFV